MRQQRQKEYQGQDYRDNLPDWRRQRQHAKDKKYNIDTIRLCGILWNEKTI